MNIKPIEYKKMLKRKMMRYAFYPTNDLLDSKYFQNIKKVRCIAFNEEGLVCMISRDGLNYWMVPGGTVEKNENPILALKRELLEEADIEIKNYKLIGFLEFQFLNKVSGFTKKYTEMWFTAEISSILPQTEDPALGYVLVRDFFEIEDMAFRFQKWGKISQYFVETLSNRSKHK